MSKKLSIVTGLALALSVGACSKEAPTAEEQPAAPAAKAANSAEPAPAVQKTSGEPEVEVATVTVDGLEAELDKTHVYDANGTQTRSEMGIIPGAKLLTHYKDYDVASTLPESKDEKLVFYCSNEMCGASKVAAKKAIASGYSQVAILPAGIAGWKAAGKTIAAADL